MNRRLSMMVAGAFTLSQAALLFLFRPLCRLTACSVAGNDAFRVTNGHIRLLGLDLGGFTVKDTGHLGGWVPQLVFLVLSAALTYAVLRAAPEVRPRLRIVLELAGAMLFAAGIADLLSLAMDPGPRSPGLTWTQWFVHLELKQKWAASVQFVLLTGWFVLPLWTYVWLLGRLSFFQDLAGGTGAGGARSEGQGRLPVLAAARERRDAVLAGLVPVVLLAVAGGPALRHTNVRRLKPVSITFDPDTRLPYHPPALVDQWSAVLYPALRMRPLKTENIGGWLGTLVICGVLLLVLAWALRAVALRMAGKRPLRLLMECWGATLIAAMSAAIVETGLLSDMAPRISPGLGRPFDAASSDAVRFGTVWGWATGVAFLGVVLALGRRQHHADSDLVEGRLNHAE